MSDLGTVAFDTSEKVDILIKDAFNVSSTNENTPWYLETNATYNTYINGEDILVDEIPKSIDWANCETLTADEMLSLYNLTSSDFATGGGIKKDPSGVLHKFDKLKLQPIPKSGITVSGTTGYYSYYHVKDVSGVSVNLLENSFQKTFGDGTSFAYAFYSEDNINLEIQPTSGGGNWFFNFKNGILFVPDPTKNASFLASVNSTKLPYFSYVKYIGKKGVTKLTTSGGGASSEAVVKLETLQTISRMGNEDSLVYQYTNSNELSKLGSNLPDIGVKQERLYNLDGTLSTTNAGYKWLSIHLHKDSSNNYYLNGSNYSEQISNSIQYIKLDEILRDNKLLDDDRITTLFNAASNNVVGFATVGMYGKKYVGDLKQQWNAFNNDWLKTDATSLSYASMRSNRHGCAYDFQTNQGMVIDAEQVEDDLRIMIGIYMENKNTDKSKLDGSMVIGKNYINQYNPPLNGMLIEGNVGIGKTNPTTTLDVSGNIKLNGVDVLSSGDNISELTNDSGYITASSSSLTSKAPLASPSFTGTPTAPTASSGTNTTQLATTAFVKTAVNDLIDGAPGVLDTLNELAAALGDDANFASTVTTSLSGKQDSITSLSRLNADLIHDGTITNSEFGYLSGVTSSIQTQLDAKLDSSANISSFTNDSGFITLSSNGTLTNKTMEIPNTSYFVFKQNGSSHYDARIYYDTNNTFIIGNTLTNFITVNSSNQMTFGIQPTYNGNNLVTDTTNAFSYSNLSGTPTIPTNNNELSNGAGYITNTLGSSLETDFTFSSYTNTSGSYSAPSMILRNKGTTDGGFFGFYNDGGTTPALCISDDGNIGVGTDDPTKFYLNSSSTGGSYTSTDRLLTIHGGVSGQSGGVARLVFSCDANHTASICGKHTTGGSTYLAFNTTTGTSAPAERMRIDNIGNVGIGTPSPSAKLHVNGDIRVVNGISFRNESTYDGTNVNCSIHQRGNSIGDGLQFNGYSGLVFTTNNGVERMRIHQNGNVGIGTTSPVCPLDVKGSDNYYMGHVSYFEKNNYNFGNYWLNSSNYKITIRAEESIAVSKYYWSTSDSRIKENIVDVSDNQALKMLKNIPCRYYEYKDKIGRGNGKSIGFIAQEVREILPMAINLQKDIIPNEMRILTDISWNNTTLYTDLSDCSGIKYRFYVSNDLSDNEVMKEVVGNPDNSFTFDKSYNHIFCYGREVNDFHTLDKNKLFALNFSATQEIDRIQQEEVGKLAEQTARITELEIHVQTLESQLESVLARLSALESSSSTT